MPYIDSTPKDYPIVFEEDNFHDVFGNMLIDNGWTYARKFYKAAVDTRAYYKLTDRVNYAVAKHTIYRNADGQLLGIAEVGQFPLYYRKNDIIRRPYDDQDPNDENYQMSPTWDEWIKQRFASTRTKTHVYFYMLEKLPNEALAPEGGVVSITTMPGMSGTSFQLERDRDREDWYRYWYGYYYYYYRHHYEIFETDNPDMEFDGKILSASPFHMLRSVLDVEVLGTKWSEEYKEVNITHTEPRAMQSPIVKTTLRAEFLEHKDHPIWHTNWWSDSEVNIKGHVDSTSFFLVLQADNAPAWENNLIPTIPLYFGKVKSMDGKSDNGYALFAGTIPPSKRKDTTRWESTYNASKIYAGTTTFLVADGDNLPAPPALLTIGGNEIVKLVEKEGNLITVEREQQGTEASSSNSRGTTIARLSTNNREVNNEKVVSLFDFDDPGATVGETIFPLLKLYPHHASNGVDSVMVSRSRFGARYQAHYLSWGAPPNQLPPVRMTEEGKKYPRAYESMENTKNYKYQFNSSRYSNKVHSSRIFVIHPEEGVRGYLDKSIGFNAQSLNTSNLRVRKQDCPTPVYEMYKYQSLGAVSPLTKKPATTFRPIGLGIYSDDFDPNKEPYDPENDTTPPGDVTITKVVCPFTQTIDVEWELPDDEDLKHVNLYVDDELYAKGITRTNFYRITGLTIGFTPKIKLTTVDMADNESSGVIAEAVTVI
ncbi:hypothetical protein [Bacillus chungangensis]|uniref:Major virion structural protein n=1 Tax=Bacillus chungangensis TaxID=587633 RepID=A0ABT9WSX6_9BACI|nr:hypothetical protein [Bacillus chungangensis]MDQ0176224.1 hypothetical protein [Bacillus chungangensis]